MTDRQTKGVPARSERLPARSEGLPARSEGLPARSEGLPARSEDLPARSEGLWAGSRGDVQTYGRTYIHTENLPILQDFVPYRGRCPKREKGKEKKGKGKKENELCDSTHCHLKGPEVFG